MYIKLKFFVSGAVPQTGSQDVHPIQNNGLLQEIWTKSCLIWPPF